jgi:hypothetical protein
MDGGSSGYFSGKDINRDTKNSGSGFSCSLKTLKLIKNSKITHRHRWQFDFQLDVRVVLIENFQLLGVNSSNQLKFGELFRLVVHLKNKLKIWIVARKKITPAVRTKGADSRSTGWHSIK